MAAPNTSSGRRRQPRKNGDRRDRYPLLAEWVAADRRDPGLGRRVAAWVDDHWRRRQRGPTWYAVAEHVRPDLAMIPDEARRWYASQLVNRLMDQGWLAENTGTSPLAPGPRFQPDPAARHDPDPSAADAEDDEPQWTPGRLF
ncbi:hypothetical protein ACGFNU_34210 [Spirillospora sp. NPDC048911]|uniref:hypothetical protein n=1 Tax=Spirillospora sp. NPDC048911 TaxID=3364527 RepID=UPI00371CD945